MKNLIKLKITSGNAQFLMFMPIWIGSIVTSILLFFAFRTSNNIVVQHRIIASIGQMIFAVVAAFAGSFVYIYFMQGVQRFDFTSANRIAIFVAFAIIHFRGPYFRCYGMARYEVSSNFLHLIFI